MPTLKEYRNDYYTFSGRASDVSRQLGFAAIAIIWVFKSDMPGKSYALAPELYRTGLAVIISLALDLFQYTIASLIWGAFWRIKETNLKNKTESVDDVNLEAPAWFNWPTLGCFWIKLLMMMVAYCYLLTFLVEHITSSYVLSVK